MAAAIRRGQSTRRSTSALRPATTHGSSQVRPARSALPFSTIRTLGLEPAGQSRLSQYLHPRRELLYDAKNLMTDVHSGSGTCPHGVQALQTLTIPAGRQADALQRHRAAVRARLLRSDYERAGP